MNCIFYPSIDPYTNLATEEYLFREFTGEIFALWRNEPSIIVGKHQNALAEINLQYVKTHGIKVVRRISGGGAVFHDLGNLNYTFIRNGESNQLVDFHKYTLPILEVLQKLGIDARFEGRNDLTIDGRKFSGNAEHAFKNRILHHGTLLFSSSLSDLRAALRADPDKFRDKAVKSVRSRVTNLSEHLGEPMDILAFKDLMMAHIMEMYPEAMPYELQEKDLEAIRNLRDEKYATWEWNFGYSPQYSLHRMIRTDSGRIELILHTNNGTIENIQLLGDFFHNGDMEEIGVLLKGCRHQESAIRQWLKGIDVGKYLPGIQTDQFIIGLF